MTTPTSKSLVRQHSVRTSSSWEWRRAVSVHVTALTKKHRSLLRSSIKHARKLTVKAQTATSIRWDSLSFEFDHLGKTMFAAKSDSAGKYSGKLCPYGPLLLAPAAEVLNYGQSVFEGLKAQYSAKDRIVLFRPDQNAERMERSAHKLCMPPVPKSLFIDAVKQVVQANSHLVPPMGKGFMYIRPLLIGSAPMLTLDPAPQFTFIVYCAAIDSCLNGGQSNTVNLLIEENIHRAIMGGVGTAKSAGNYSQVLVTLQKAKQQGYDDVVFLDAVCGKYLEEMATCNIFVVKNEIIKTPPLQETVLSGVTRQSVIQLARDEGFTVVEDRITAEEAMDADEVFITSTAVVLSMVGSLTYHGQRRQFGQDNQSTTLGFQLYKKLTQLQDETSRDLHGWVHPVDKP